MRRILGYIVMILFAVTVCIGILVASAQQADKAYKMKIKSYKPAVAFTNEDSTPMEAGVLKFEPNPSYIWNTGEDTIITLVARNNEKGEYLPPKCIEVSADYIDHMYIKKEPKTDKIKFVIELKEKK